MSFVSEFEIKLLIFCTLHRKVFESVDVAIKKIYGDIPHKLKFLLDSLQLVSEVERNMALPSQEAMNDELEVFAGSDFPKQTIPNISLQSNSSCTRQSISSRSAQLPKQNRGQQRYSRINQCKYVALGMCHHGRNCWFVHDDTYNEQKRARIIRNEKEE